MFHQFLSHADSERALRCFSKLMRHDIARWTLTGGLAVELHRLRQGRRPPMRPLNDIDYIVDSFECIPQSLADDFLFRHIHPSDPPGKTLLQLVDPDTALRIDVFRACGGTIARASTVELPIGSLQLISLEDLAARTARLALDLAGGSPTPTVHATDFLRLADLVDPAEVETAWRDHRKPAHPATFAETDRLLRDLIPRSQNLLIAREYSTDCLEICPRCRETSAFHFADPGQVLALLGYV